MPAGCMQVAGEPDLAIVLPLLIDSWEGTEVCAACLLASLLIGSRLASMLPALFPQMPPLACRLSPRHSICCGCRAVCIVKSKSKKGPHRQEKHHGSQICTCAQLAQSHTSRL